MAWAEEDADVDGLVVWAEDVDGLVAWQRKDAMTKDVEGLVADDMMRVQIPACKVSSFVGSIPAYVCSLMIRVALVGAKRRLVLILWQCGNLASGVYRLRYPGRGCAMGASVPCSGGRACLGVVIPSRFT
ncbi:hypothetical protein THAOC_11675 [Thalassiosira oceanica]|uniref:Uncharacterized protein n=1 Tax=Thalassiosira oceanica TaxID=159749 RepID=K0SPR8_THAOC|nr:hypothetical protein THAOC_11675 [Thalassiosira oceanica]|eukprot:EJK67310.1 hypothetical protein THAOC_11675 [Thalassiosira oceanica]